MRGPPGGSAIVQTLPGGGRGLGGCLGPGECICPLQGCRFHTYISSLCVPTGLASTSSPACTHRRSEGDSAGISRPVAILGLWTPNLLLPHLLLIIKLFCTHTAPVVSWLSAHIPLSPHSIPWFIMTLSPRPSVCPLLWHPHGPGSSTTAPTTSQCSLRTLALTCSVWRGAWWPVSHRAGPWQEARHGRSLPGYSPLHYKRG